MWITLFLAVAAYIAVLYVPGFLMARSLRISRFASVVMAPILSVCTLTVLGIALGELGVSSTGGLLLFLTVAISLTLFAITRISGKRRQTNDILEIADVRTTCKTAALYVALALAMTFALFLLAIDGPESFSRNDDTTVHLALIRTFIETGVFSPLHASSYLDQEFITSFYPAAWHITTAVVASFFGNAVTLAANASIIVLTTVVFPLGICLLMTRLFAGNKHVVLAGSLFVLAFGAFPWGFIVWGQLLSNMLSFILVPLALVALIEAIETPRIQDKIRLGIVIAAGLVAIALSQPNGAFTFGIWAILYCVNRVFYPHAESGAVLTRKRITVAAFILAAACALWAVAYFLPFMQTIVQHTWKATLSPIEGLGAGLLFMFTVRGGVQPFLSIVVLAGALHTFKNRRYLWLTVAYALALFMYIIDVSTDSVFKHVLTGFWYTDCYRTAAMAALFAMPLAALGFVQITRIVRCWCTKLGKPKGEKAQTCAALCVVLAVYLVMQFIPLHVSTSKATIYTGPVKIHKEVTSRYSWNRVLTGEEDAFIKRALEVIPEGSLVINAPNDGSCWSYGVEGINTYFRRCANTGRGSAEESQLIRTQLCNISTNNDVRSVINNIDARYVLQLDEPASESPTTTNQRYKAENWAGIESITEETPGFNLILSEGDMRLYEIER